MKKGRMVLQAGWHVRDIWVPWATQATACIYVLPPRHPQLWNQVLRVSVANFPQPHHRLYAGALVCPRARVREGIGRPTQRSTMFAHGGTAQAWRSVQGGLSIPRGAAAPPGPFDTP